jgi:hypothetical protein
MADRDEGAEPRAHKRAKKPKAVKKMAAQEPTGTDASSDAAPAGESPEARAERKARAREYLREEEAGLREKFRAGPRRPVQIVEARKSFWVFCDDGSVCIATPKKGGVLKWFEASPPMPGSVADMNGQLGAAKARAHERAARAASEAT